MHAAFEMNSLFLRKFNRYGLAVVARQAFRQGEKAFARDVAHFDRRRGLGLGIGAGERAPVRRVVVAREELFYERAPPSAPAVRLPGSDPLRAAQRRQA